MAYSEWRGNCRQTTAAFFCGLGGMTVGLMIGWPAAAFPKVLRHETPFHLSIFDESWIISFLNIGSIASTIPCSFIMDKVGRKATFLIFSIFAPISWALIAFASSVEMLYLGRLLGGVYAGGYLTVLPIYLAEILHPSMRGSLGTLSTILNNSGTLMAYWIGPHVSFRDLALISCSIGIAFLISVVFMPETPYLLIMKKDYARANSNLAWLRGTADVSEELESIQTFIETEKTKPTEITDIWLDDRYRRPFLSCIGLLFLQKGSGYFTVIANQTIILPDQVWGLDSEDSTFIIGVILVIMAIVAAFLMDVSGRRVLLQMSNIGQAVSMLFVGVWYYSSIENEARLEEYNYVPLLAFCTYVITFSVGLGPVPHIYIGEVLPPLIKARATGLLVCIAATALIVVNEFFAVIATFADIYVNFFCFGLSSLIGIYYVHNHIIETRGKSLQEIQEEFRDMRSRRGDYYIID